jgi:hypothetical protein
MAKKTVLEEKFPERRRRIRPQLDYMSAEPDETGDLLADSEAHLQLSRDFKREIHHREVGAVAVQQVLEAILLELRAQRAILTEIRDKEA